MSGGGRSGRSGHRTARWIWVVGIASSVALGLPLIRVLIALLYGVRESRGTPAAVSIAAAIFSAPMIAVALRHALGSRAAAVLALTGLATASAIVQVAHPIEWWVAGLGVACALAAWALLLHAHRLRTTGAGPSFAFAFMLGLAVDTWLHSSFGTWDAAWQSSPAALAVTFLCIVALLATTAALTRDVPNDPAEGTVLDALPVAALGPFLALHVLFLHNVAFTSAASETSIAVGAGAVLAGVAGAMAATIWGPRWTNPAVRSAAAATMVTAAWVLPGARGLVVLPVLVLAGALSGWLLSIALARAPEVAGRAGAWRTGVAATAGSLTFVAILFSFQIHASQPLPVSNRVLPLVAAALLCVAAWGGLPQRRREGIGAGRAIGVPIALAALLTLSPGIATSGPPGSTTYGRSLRIMSWNVHSAVDATGQVVPDSVADAIVTQRPDVVVLQEVSRGWPIGGSLDLATWLSDRLDMPFVWGPAADASFGNLVLSHVPIVEVDDAILPYGSGPQDRSLVRVVLDAGDSTVTLVGTHLETGRGTDTRARQIEAVLGDVASEERAVIAGDMNMQPSDNDVSLFTDAGYLSAQDEANESDASTARAPRFAGDRPDWIFGSADLTLTSFHIVKDDTSDHLPLVVTYSW